jgi:dolichol-phosphate mannosyltransferase
MTIKYSVIVPAFHEVLNIKPLTERLFSSLKTEKIDNETELIIVDDNSNDGTEDEVKKLQDNGYNIKIIVRKNEKGLSSAVLRGFDESSGNILVCMDADLQHPPEKVPELISKLKDDVEFVIGTRYGEGAGIDKDWPLYRQIISKGSIYFNIRCKIPCKTFNFFI